MAQYDVYELPRLRGYVVDCQSDLLNDLSTRFIIPLTAVAEDVPITNRLNPRFWIAGNEYFLNTRYLGSMPRSALHDPVMSLTDQDFRIVAAIDFLMRGF